MFGIHCYFILLFSSLLVSKSHIYIIIFGTNKDMLNLNLNESFATHSPGRIVLKYFSEVIHDTLQISNVHNLVHNGDLMITLNMTTLDTIWIMLMLAANLLKEEFFK